ncbi:MAG: hypothetical protein GEU78_09635 [Actinobacteria bacterium]|nr:hypothetical protein [Actinomycetota bacterium]
MSTVDPYDPEPHIRRHNEASARLLVALDPQTEAEQKLVTFLMTNWDTSTLTMIAAMVERRIKSA